MTIEQDGKLLGFSRVAYSLSELEKQAAQLQHAVAFALLVAFGITAVLATLLVPPGLGSMKAIMEAAHRFVAGDLSARSDVQRSDELDELANILNATSDLLQERLHENERDQARTRAILSAMEDGVLAVDCRGIALVANQTLIRGLDLQDPLGRHCTEVVHQGEVGPVIERVLRTGPGTPSRSSSSGSPRLMRSPRWRSPGRPELPPGPSSRSTTSPAVAASSRSDATFRTCSTSRASSRGRAQPCGSPFTRTRRPRTSSRPSSPWPDPVASISSTWTGGRPWWSPTPTGCVEPSRCSGHGTRFVLVVPARPEDPPTPA